jgi:nucleolar protein 14
MELDEGLDDLRELLAESAPKGKMKSNLDFYKAPVAEQEKSADDKKSEQEKIDYDQYVRSLAFDRRAKPKDRTKTEEETVKEEAEKLQEAEAARLKRMRGEVDEDEDEEEPGGRRRRRNTGEKSRKPEADDLDDDYMDGSEDGDAKEFGLGDGLGARQAVLKEDGSEVDNEEEDEDDEDEDEEDEDEDDDLEEEADDLDDLASEMDEEDVASEEDVEAASSRLTKKSTLKSKGKGKSVKKEIPFTFKCPESYEDFLEIVEGLDDEDVETVVKRIRTLYHPSLGEGNKERLQGLLGILLEHVVQATPVQESMNLVTLLAPHINALVALNPLTAAEHFKSMLAEMHEILMEELANSKSTESTFPDLGELAVLRMIGTLWSTSDFSHPVSVPAALYMGQNLSQGRVKGLGDIAAGLFMAAIFLQVRAVLVR